jgi:RND superfamily putative drug exporter
MHRLTTFITGKKTSWIILVVALALSAAVFALGSGSSGETSPGVGLPDSAESARVAALQAQLPASESTSALLVYSRDGDELSEADVAAVTASAQSLGAEDEHGEDAGDRGVEGDACPPSPKTAPPPWWSCRWRS